MELKQSDIFKALTATLIWGSFYLVAKVATETSPPLVFSMQRFILVACLTLPFVQIPRAALPRIAALALLFGIGHLSIGMLPFRSALDVSTIILVGLLAVPMLSLLGMIFFRERLRALQIGGMGLAFVGVALVVGAPQHFDLLAIILLLVSCLMWAVSMIVMKGLPEIGPQQLFGWISLFSILPCLLLSLTFEDHGEIFQSLLRPQSWLAPLYAGVGSTIVAYGLWYQLLKRLPVTVLGVFALLPPVFGVISSAIFFNQSLSAATISGAVLALIGVALVTIGKGSDDSPAQILYRD